ncbi:hypothetical protein G7054_g2691 [Neopestalotiopsis clavispora]|nr:hypothetical protein E8E14_008634 [Neopestalotiopsis sp. 37M]KAF7538681.1 hypothetical protein G7054_g2691 [Neopestalotiopsis clavispora]
MLFTTAILSSFALLSHAAATPKRDMEVASRASTTGGVWFFSDGCHDTNGYSGIPITEGKTLTCMSGETDKEGVAVEGPYTNIVTDKLEELGLKLTLWNDTECTQLITTVDTDGCTVVPANNHITRFNLGPA